MIYLFFLLGALVFPVLLILTDTKENHKTSLYFKVLGSLSFVILGSLGLKHHKNTYAYLILLALISGFIGDVLLHVRHLYQESRALLYLGGSFFLLGHLFYITVILKDLRGRFLLPLSIGLCLALGFSLAYRSMQKMGRIFRFLCIIYIVFVLSFASFAGGLYFTDPSRPRLLLFIGSVLFASSDMVLIYDLIAAEKKKWCSPVLLILYYLGQSLIALSPSL